jgi:hypothetical protein
MLVLIAAAFLARRRRRDRPELWWSLATWGGATLLLMSSVTLFFWEHLPKLRFVQLPWRWLLCLNIALAIFLAIGVRRLITRVGLVLAFATVLILGWHRIQPPWWDSADDIAEMRDDFSNGTGYEGTDEYVPTGADPYEINKSAPRVSWQGDGKMLVHERIWKPERKEFAVTVARPGSLVLRLFNFPAWKVSVNGSPAVTQTTEETGQMVIPLAAGKPAEKTTEKCDVTITLQRTWDRTLGAAISGMALVVAALLGWSKKQTLRLRMQPAPAQATET